MTSNPEGSENPETGVELQSDGNAEVMANALQRNAKATLKTLESNPDWGNFIGGMVLDSIPVVGGIQKVAEARKNFGKYPLENNSPQAEAERQAARERCLIGIVEVLVDTLSGGATAALPDELLTILNRINLLIKTQGKGEKLGGTWGKVLGKVDVVGYLARMLLKIPHLTPAIDTVLTVLNHRLDKWQKQLPPPQE